MHKTASLLLIMTSSQICEWWTGLCYLEGSAFILIESVDISLLSDISIHANNIYKENMMIKVQNCNIEATI